MPLLLVKFDEDLPALAVSFLMGRGYDVRTVPGQGWCGTKESKLWPLIQREGAFLVTADKGFGDIRVYPPGTHHGILVLRPDHESALQYVRLLELVLKSYTLDQLTGTVAVVNSAGIRIRRSPTI